MKKIVLVLVLVATFGLSTQSAYAFNTGNEFVDTTAWTGTLGGITLLGVGIGYGITDGFDDIISMTCLITGGACLLIGLGTWGLGSVLYAYSEVENNSAFKFAQITATEQKDFNWTPIISSDFEGNMNYGAAMAYRF